MSNSRGLRLALLPLFFTLVAGESLAQAVTIDFVNAEMDPIPLLNGTSVGIDGDGNLTAQCVLGEDSDVCAGITTTEPPGPVPVVTLTRTNGTGTITTGNPLALSWSALPAAEICLATSSPVVTGWNNTLVAAAGGTANLTMSTAGTYTLSLKCYNASGVSNIATVNATVQGNSIGTIPACSVPGLTETGRVQPEGFTGHLLQWSAIFGSGAFPNMPSHVVPTGSFSLRTILDSSNRGPNMNARYITVPFTPAANQNYKISWLGAQAVLVAGYSNPRSANSVFVSVSPCAGDLRGKNTSGGPELAACRGQVRSGAVFFGTTANSQCKLEAGQPYFLNIAFVETSGTGPLSLTTTTCATGNRCEGNFDN